MYWKAKIWALLHDPALKGLRERWDFGDEGPWQCLACMKSWESPKSDQSSGRVNRTWLKHVGRCDLIASASDRSTIGRLPAPHSAVTYSAEGLEIRHLLSGKPQCIKLTDSSSVNGIELKRDRLKSLEEGTIPSEIRNCLDARKVFWWFWRCYPEALAEPERCGEQVQHCNQRSSSHKYSQLAEPERCGEQVQLLPAETRIPDASLWSHTSITSALAGALAGYHRSDDDYPQFGKSFNRSRPHIGTFTFTPVQELIKASRKMRDFWAGSWLLHYLSAKVCWEIAWKYGPDVFLYPCLYEQPLIDLWLLQKYPDFKDWIKKPDEKKLLTAGFPNVLVTILPDNGVEPSASNHSPISVAMGKQARQALREEWTAIGGKVLNSLRERHRWRNIYPKLWDEWLSAQWQIYWVSSPLGCPDEPLHKSPRKREDFEQWKKNQNEFARPAESLFLKEEDEIFTEVFRLSNGTENPERISKQPNINVGSWWASLFDLVRHHLTAVKNARSWVLPTAFGPRSTLSGIGPVLHPVYDDKHPDWATEGQTQKFWSAPMGLFDGIEELNATEVLKRGLHQVLGQVLGEDEGSSNRKIKVRYPDLSSGVAGWIKDLQKRGKQGEIRHYREACESVYSRFSWVTEEVRDAFWGIPWIDDNQSTLGNLPNPRLLNAGWLIDEFVTEDRHQRSEQLSQVKEEIQGIQGFFRPGNNPTDWYVLAAGDGDSMGEWLKGTKMKEYKHYIADALNRKIPSMPDPLRLATQRFLDVRKRMGPATHAALSRALLDFSNQLVPYLTEERYAGRLIYGGGDDVLAYTNLWEWDSWLWDIRQCFRGAEDPQGEFSNPGDYWQSVKNKPASLPSRPLFTMGSTATISFGIVIAHHSVPLAIALENLWEAEDEAKKHESPNGEEKDAVQVRVLYGNGNILESTAKFDTFDAWRSLLTSMEGLEPALFEQVAQVWEQHPAPVEAAIQPWVKAFCDRRDLFEASDDRRQNFNGCLVRFLSKIWETTSDEARGDGDRQIRNWLKLAAFILRNRDIRIIKHQGVKS